MKKFAMSILCLLPFFGCATEEQSDKTRLHPYLKLGIGASSAGHRDLNPLPGGGAGIYFTKKDHFVDISVTFHKSKNSSETRKLKVLSFPRSIYGVHKDNLYFGAGLSWMNVKQSIMTVTTDPDAWNDYCWTTERYFNGIAVCTTIGYNFAKNDKFTNSIELNIDQAVAKTNGNSLPIFAGLYWKVGF